MSQQILTAIRLLRPQSVILMCLFLMIPIGIHTQSITYAIVIVLPFFLLLCGEIALNDVCDIEKDRINKPQRPLVSGSLSVRTGFLLAITCILIAGVLGAILYYDNLWRIIIFYGLLVILSCYNIPSRIMPLIKAFITAGATILSLSFLLTFNSLQQPVLSLSSAFTFILGRELLMDIRDYDGDRQNGYITIAITVGKEKTFLGAITCFGLSMILCMAMVLRNLSPLRLFAGILVLLTTSLLVVLFSHADTVKLQNRIALLLWLPIIEMLILFV